MINIQKQLTNKEKEQLSKFMSWNAVATPYCENQNAINYHIL